MNVGARFRHHFIVIGLSLFASASNAADNITLNLSLPGSNNESVYSKSFLLADSEVSSIDSRNTIVAVTPAAEFEPKLITGKKIHEYMGLATLALAGLTLLTAPDGDCNYSCNNANQARPVNGTHAEFGKATAVMALATVASGLIVHWDDFSMEDGWEDPDNLHVLLGVTGAALLAYAVNKSMNVSSGQANHAGIAELGALGMLVAVKLTW